MSFTYTLKHTLNRLKSLYSKETREMSKQKKKY